MLTLRARFALFCLSIGVLAGAIAASAMFASARMGKAIDRVGTTAVMIRQHTVADMLHDTLRADVYVALHRSSTGDPADEPVKQVHEHAGEFLKSIEAVRQASASEEVGTTLAALDAPLRAYIELATRIVGLAFADRDGALLQMEEFDRRFEALETAMDKAGDVIEADGRQAQADADAARRLADGLALASLVASLLFAGALYLVIRNSVVGPLSAIAKAMQALAGGDTNLSIPHADRSDEMGAMAKSIGVFRTAIEARARDQRARLDGDLQAAEERRRVMDQLTRRVGEVIEAAGRGDFSARIEEGGAEDLEVREMTRRLNQLMETIDDGLSETLMVLTTLTQGDLSMRVRGNYRGAFAALKAGTNTLGDHLGDALGRLAASALAVRTATGDITTGIQDLSDRAASQADTVSETCRSLADFAGSIRDNAARAGQASDIVRAAEAQARQGGEVLLSAREAMNRISASSTRISDIVELIDGVAFQTNLLALNAAVEAARAGEVGRGFAVVAAEVRTLAQRAAEASHEIKGLIGRAQAEIVSGVSLVEETSQQLESIFTAVSDVTGIVGTIASASDEQAGTVAGLNEAVSHLGDVARHNATLVRHIHAAISATEQETERLEELAGQFTTGARPGMSRAA